MNANAICTSNVALVIGTGTAPSISWTPSCKVVFLTVEDASSGDDRWAVQLPSGFSAPVTYGVTPAGATVTTPPVALVAGTTYIATLYNSGSLNGIIAVSNFTP